MTDIEDRLRAYGRTADQHIEPIDRDELRTTMAPSAPPVEPLAAPATRHWWRAAGLVAASVIALVAIAAVTRGGSTTVTDDPGTTDPDSELTELPAPDLVVVDQTSIGTITWQRTIATTDDLPEIIEGVDDGGALIGRDRDPAITWRSTDDGLTWVRTIGDGVRTTINGIEWISRDDLTDEQPSALSYDDGTGERKMPLPDLDLDVPAPFVVERQLGGRIDGLPYSIDGRAIFAVVYTVVPDWSVITFTDDWSNIDVRTDQGGWGTSRSDRVGPSFTYELRVSDDDVALVDADGDVALSVGTTIDGLDGFDPVKLLAGGQATTRLYEFVDGRLRLVSTPWTTGQRTLVSAVDGGLLAYRFDPPDQPLVAWHSADGVSWTEVDLPVDTSNGGDGYINAGIDDELVLFEQPNGPRAWTSTDGLTYTEIPTPPSGLRTGGNFGWATVENYDSPRFQVSSDGIDWDRVDISALLDPGSGRTFDYLEFKAIDDQIFLTSARDGQRLLLIGHVAPPTD